MTDSFLDAVGLDRYVGFWTLQRSGLVGNVPIISCMGLGQSKGCLRSY